MSDSKTRKDFLGQWRQGLWSQIRQKEDAIWRFISFYAGAIILVIGFVQGDNSSGSAAVTDSGFMIISLTILVVTFWGVLIVLDANFWMQRNLIFIGNIEREILSDTDLGVLIPRSYTQPTKFRYSQSYEIHSNIFFFTIFLVLIAFTSLILNKKGMLNRIETASLGLIAIVFCLGLIYILERDWRWVREFLAVRGQAPGKNLTIKDFSNDFEVIDAYWSSSISLWAWFLTFLGCGIFLYLAIIVQTQYRFQPWFKSVILSLFAIIAFSRLIIYPLVKKVWLRDCEKKLSQLENKSEINQYSCFRYLERTMRVLMTVEILFLTMIAFIWLILVLLTVINPLLGTI